MDMETLLADLFDYQRFEKDPALQSVIEEADGQHFGEELGDDELDMLSAAGDPFLMVLDSAERDARP